MKVTHIVTLDNLGGAAIATSRLNFAMRSCGIDSNVITLFSTPISYAKIKYPLLSRLSMRKIGATHIERGLFSYANFGYNVTKMSIVADADVIYIHWINGVLSLSNIEQICSMGKPVLLFLHDMWHLTGGCHHSFGCDGYTKECKDCPVFISSSKLPEHQLSKKHKIFNKYKNVTVVTPSKWLSGCARKSSLFANHRVETIKNCINTNIFKQVDRRAAREFMNLPTDKKIICFGAHKSTANPYKGWSYLQEALKEFCNDDFAILLFGEEYNKEIADTLPFATYFSGYLKDEYSMALLYNAIDLFVMPSLAEAFGMVAVETLSCGAMVTAFDTGGIPDIIVSGKRGYLANYKDSTDLANGIREMLKNPTPVCREWIEENCSYKSVAKQHIELCNSLKLQ